MSNNGKSEMVNETRVMRSIATQLGKLTTSQSRARVLQFVQSSVYEAQATEEQAKREAFYKSNTLVGAPQNALGITAASPS